MLNFVQKVSQDFKLRNLNLNKYEPRIHFTIEQGPYLLKTATSLLELKAAFRLRHHVFFNDDLGDQLKLDVDIYDSLCDHLIIVDQTTQNIVGTYRLNYSRNLKDFYSHSQYDLKSFVLPQAQFLELGRACIAKQHRTGPVISLLWKGIYFYMRQIKADILFGCSSIKNIPPFQAALLMKYFEQKLIFSTSYKIIPRRQFKIPQFDEHYQSLPETLSEHQINEAEKIIPSLLKTYIKVGAKIISEPAYDKDMNCIDFLTCLNVENLAQRYEKRLGKLQV